MEYAPVWWPAFCAVFDIAAVGLLAWLLLHPKLAASFTKRVARAAKPGSPR